MSTVNSVTALMLSTGYRWPLTRHSLTEETERTMPATRRSGST